MNKEMKHYALVLLFVAVLAGSAVTIIFKDIFLLSSEITWLAGSSMVVFLLLLFLDEVFGILKCFEEDYIPYFVGEKYYTLIPRGGKWVVLEVLVTRVVIELDSDGDYNGECHAMFVGELDGMFYCFGDFGGMKRSLSEDDLFDTVEEAEEEAKDRIANGWMPVEVKDLC